MQQRDTLIHYLLDKLYYYEEGQAYSKACRQVLPGGSCRELPSHQHEVQAIIHAQFEAAMHKLIETFNSAGEVAG